MVIILLISAFHELSSVIIVGKLLRKFVEIYVIKPVLTAKVKIIRLTSEINNVYMYANKLYYKGDIVFIVATVG